MIRTALAALALAATLSAPAASLAVERPAHQVVFAADGYEIRRYPAMLQVQTDSAGPYNRFRRDQRRPFMRLFDYIRGDNRREDRIEMTNPVFVQPRADAAATVGERIEMTNPVFIERAPAGDRWTMSYSLPARFTLETIPQPLREDVRIVEQPPMLVAVGSYSGFANDVDEAETRAELRAWIAANGYRVVGPRWLGFYDPPWTPGFLRTNEVLIPVEAAR